MSCPSRKLALDIGHALNQHVEVKAFVLAAQAQSEGVLGDLRAQISAVGRSHLAVTGDVHIADVASLATGGDGTLVVPVSHLGIAQEHTVCLVTVVHLHRVADEQVAAVTYHAVLLGDVTHTQRQDFVLDDGEVTADAILEVTDLVRIAQVKLPAFVLHGTGVHLRHVQSEDGRVAGRRRVEHIRSLAVEIGGVEGQVVLEETGLNTHVCSAGAFPFQGRVHIGGDGCALGIDPTEHVVQVRAQRVNGLVRVVTDVIVTQHTDRGFHLQVAEPVEGFVFLPEALLGHTPADSSRGEGTVLTVSREAGRTVVAHSGFEQVTLVVVVGQTAEQGLDGPVVTAAAVGLSVSAAGIQVGYVVRGEVVAGTGQRALSFILPGVTHQYA